MVLQRFLNEIRGLSELKYSYDDENDVLYLHVGDPQPSVSELLVDGIYVKKHPDTKKVVGFIFMDFMRRAKEATLPTTTHIGIKGELQPV